MNYAVGQEGIFSEEGGSITESNYSLKWLTLYMKKAFEKNRTFFSETL